jgi:probable HAF family extracellular repeat protein
VLLKDGTGTWQTARIDFSPSEAAESLYLRFRFASIDYVNNGYDGFYVDDIVVCGVGAPCLAPVESSAPDPADEATAVPRSVVLTWTGDDTDCRTTYDVYLDTVDPPGPASLVCFGGEEPTCDVGTLGFDTFYWTVVARNALGVEAGPIWSFTTIDCLSDEDCDDGVGCTDNTCGPVGCVYTANNANCGQDASFCNGLELCDPQLDCISAGDPCAPGLLCSELLDTCQFDCNSNGTADGTDLLLGPSDDCNSNGWPDECEVVGPYALKPSFTGLGDLEGGEFGSYGLGVSANGLVVEGVGQTEFGQEAFRWTAEGGMEGLGDLPGGQYESGALEASANGSAIVGAGHLQRDETGRPLNIEAFRWTSSGMEGLGDLAGGGFLSSATGVSAGGRVVVGSGNSEEGTLGFRWTSALGMVSLGDLEGDPLGSEATDVSNDGSVIVGSGNVERNEGGVAISSEAFRWTAGTGLVPLGDLAGGDYLSWATGVSGDGAVVVGASQSDQGSEAFRWTEATGMVALWAPASVLSSAAYAASRDGSIVVGYSYTDTGPQAFIWDERAGMRYLQDVLVDDFGLDLSGWSLWLARDVSDDGQVIVGYGINPSGDGEAWRAVVPRIWDCNSNGVPDECDDVPGDFNGNAYTDVSDLPGFAECQTEPCADPPCAPARYENPCCILADADRDGDVDLDDFAAVQVSFDLP